MEGIGIKHQSYIYPTYEIDIKMADSTSKRLEEKVGFSFIFTLIVLGFISAT